MCVPFIHFDKIKYLSVSFKMIAWNCNNNKRYAYSELNKGASTSFLMNYMFHPIISSSHECKNDEARTLLVVGGMQRALPCNESLCLAIPSTHNRITQIYVKRTHHARYNVLLEYISIEIVCLCISKWSWVWQRKRDSTNKEPEWKRQRTNKKQ